MNASLYLTLLNPAASAIFAAAFFGFWRYQPRQRYLIWLWICYAASGVGFVLQSVDLPIGHAPTRVVSNLCFASAAFAMGCGIAWKYGHRPHYVALAAFGLAGVSGVAWFWYVPDVVMRVYSISFAIGAMILISALPIASHRNKNFIDYALLCMFLLQGSLFFVRTYLTVHLGGMEDPKDPLGSPFWLVLSFSHAILSIILVFMLILDAALDVERDLKVESETDQLSGLLNRRGFKTAATEKLTSPMSGRLPLALVLCDLDHFKSINDTFGHHVGDEVIASFARVMRDIVGPHHFIGRVGGEEFAILIVGGDAAVAELVAHGVRVGFSAAPTPGHIGATRRLSASFGVAQALPGELYDDLIHRADAALYRAKGDGRDCVRVDLPVEAQPRSTLPQTRGRDRA